MKSRFAILTAALLLGSIALLAACSNPEVDDLKAISEAVKATGYSKEANQKFQDRLMAAKSEEEQKAIVEEMMVFFRPLPEKLNAIGRRQSHPRQSLAGYGRNGCRHRKRL